MNTRLVAVRIRGRGKFPHLFSQHCSNVIESTQQPIYRTQDDGTIVLCKAARTNPNRKLLTETRLLVFQSAIGDGPGWIGLAFAPRNSPYAMKKKPHDITVMMRR